jgi:transposase-like protein
VLTAKRDAAGAQRFFRKALSSPGNGVPRVINVDKNPAAVEALKKVFFPIGFVSVNVESRCDAVV